MITDANSELKTTITNIFHNSPDLEYAYIEWISKTLNNPNILTFETLIKNPSNWFELADKAGLFQKTKIPKAKQSLSNFVEILGDFWKNNFQLDLFFLFDPIYKNELYFEFEFSCHFQDILYSNHLLVLTSLVTGVLLTSFLVNPKMKNNSSIFESISSLSPDSQVILAENFTAIESLSQEIEDKVSTGKQKQSTQSFLQTSDQLKLQEKLASVKDKYKKLKLVNFELNSLIKCLETQFQEQEFKLEQANFSKNDLVNKFKSCSLIFETEEIRQKEEEITALRNLISNKDSLFQRSVVDFEKTQEGLYKKIKLLDSFQIKYEKLAQKENDVVELNQNMQIIKIENKSLKQKCDLLNSHLSNLENENKHLLEKNKEYKTQMNSQFEVENKSLACFDFKLEKTQNQCIINGKLLLNDLNDSFMQAFQNNGPVLIKQKENQAETQNLKFLTAKETQKENNQHLKILLKQFNDDFSKFLNQISESIKFLMSKNEQLESFKIKSKFKINFFEERVKDLENLILANLKLEDSKIKELYECLLKTPFNFQETNTTMLNAILTRELEINYLKNARKNVLSEFLKVESNYAEQIKLIYTLAISNLRQ